MNNILFFGTYTHKVDSKGRVSIPAEWRKHLIENGIVFYAPSYFNSIQNAFKYSSCEMEKFLPFIKVYNLDKEGRVVFKESKNKLTVLKGCGDYFTIEFRD
jgi:DNA-binding transcriptional regulator/RsmH inhibitor MraZ